MTSIVSGTVDQGFYFVAVDATDLASREDGLSSFTVYRSRNNAAAAVMTTPTVTEVDATNMPGVYFLLCDEDMTIGSGNVTEVMAYHITHAGMAPVTREIELVQAPVTVGAIADAVADEPEDEHTTANTMMKAISDAKDSAASANSTATSINNNVAALENISAADVNAQVVDALATDTYAEPGQGAPAATATLAAKINYIYKAWRNKKEQTATTMSLYDDAGTTVDQKSTVSDNGTTATRGEIVSGP